ncbi:MAG: ABC transporter ATP-binding protein [Coriobacteriaceae bacterium]|nr:ABC transporter ATP-binding protein [Coriobacteriaceae bacterium]
MSRPFVRLMHVQFAYPSSVEPLFDDLTLHFGPGWSGVVGGNGTGKTTLLRLATGQLAPDEGLVEAPDRVAYCPQRTDDPPAELADFLLDEGRVAARLRDRLGIAADFEARWESLSHGERKRAQIAAALWTEPDVLAVDEPTNHLDGEARDQLETALGSFGGVGILVSHDRALLDALCAQCVFIDPPDVVARPGGITAGQQVAAQEREAAASSLDQDRLALKKTRREAARREALSATADRRRSKRGLDPHDHDSRDRINRARVTGKDGVGGKLLSQMQGQVARIEQRIAEADIHKEYTIGVDFAGVASKRDALLRLPAGALPLGPGDVLTIPPLVIRPTDRIALTGLNGTGKSTLLRFLAGHLELPPERCVIVSQEIDAAESVSLLQEVRALGSEELGHLMTLVSRLGSRPQRLLTTAQPSPGETRKLVLALGLLREPHLIVMDEPTNHMDLPSIEALEEALDAVRCALLLVSHDARFLARLTTISWRIAPDPLRRGSYQLHVE